MLLITDIDIPILILLFVVNRFVYKIYIPCYLYRLIAP